MFVLVCTAMFSHEPRKVKMHRAENKEGEMTKQVHQVSMILVPDGASMSTQSSKDFTLTIATVTSVEAAVELIRSIDGHGLTHVELSASFGDEGLERIQEVAEQLIRVGRVHYEGE